MRDIIQDYSAYLIREDRPPLSGLDALVHRLQGQVRRRWGRRRLYVTACRIAHAAEGPASMDDPTLFRTLEEIRHRVRMQREEGDIIEHALSYLVEAADRTLSMRPYPVQLMGALALIQQYAIQMQPGEGKTLTACLAAIVLAWRGGSCHIITSNDYLAQRDATLMQSMYERCGVTVGCVLGSMSRRERQVNYRRNIVYATSKELLADYLRDGLALPDGRTPDQIMLMRLERGTADTVMHGMHTAIVDEADSVLIDDATTPLIISVPRENRMLKEAVRMASRMSSKFVAGEHYTVNRRQQEIDFTDAGLRLIEEIHRELPDIWRTRSRSEELLKQALLARELYELDRHYVIIDGRIVIVDEQTGRLMEGRSWSYGLHQAIEAKENLPLSDPVSTNARMSFQRFFRLYKHLSGMSGTFQNVEHELWHVYGLPVVRIPTRLPNRRMVMPDRVFATKEAKFQSVVEEVVRWHRRNRPVLVGTRSIAESEMLARLLTEEGVRCRVLNAVHHREEAEIVAQAGQAGCVTIATNMAGRGTDILLGPGVEEMGGLHVIATERHESRRVDWQLFGRSGRQGQPGSAQAFVSVEDHVVCQVFPHWFILTLQKVSRVRGGSAVVLFFYRLAQRTSEWSASLLRKRMLHDDYKMDEMLSFARNGRS